MLEIETFFLGLADFISSRLMFPCVRLKELFSLIANAEEFRENAPWRLSRLNCGFSALVLEDDCFGVTESNFIGFVSDLWVVDRLIDMFLLSFTLFVTGLSFAALKRGEIPCIFDLNLEE